MNEEREAWNQKMVRCEEAAGEIHKMLNEWTYEYVMDYFDRHLKIKDEYYELVVDDEGRCQDPMQVKRESDGALFRIDVDVSVWPDREAMKP